MFTFAAVALLALMVTGTAEAAKTVQAEGTRSCGAGYKTVTKVTRKHGHTTVVRFCTVNGARIRTTFLPRPRPRAPCVPAASASTAPSPVARAPRPRPSTAARLP